MTERSGVEITTARNVAACGSTVVNSIRSLNAWPPRCGSSNPSSMPNATATPSSPNGRSGNRSSVNCSSSDVGALTGF
jgi:hypothetical protein